jgi:hypothetical protein
MGRASDRRKSRRRQSRGDRSTGLSVGLAILVFVFSFAAYLPSRSSAFVWDDQPYHLAGNAQLMRGDYAAFWTKPYRDFYIPVTYTLWTWIAQRADHNGDLRLEAFRTVNLLVHAANSVLVLWLLYLLLQSTRPALLGAAVFAIHPLQVESVVWISELRGLLAALFSLIALVLHCQYSRGDSRRRHSRLRRREVSWWRFLPNHLPRCCHWSLWLLTSCCFRLACLERGGSGRWDGSVCPFHS